MALPAQTTQIAGDASSLGTRREELHIEMGDPQSCFHYRCSGPILVRVLSTLAWVMVTATILVPLQSLFKEKNFLKIYLLSCLSTL